MSLLITILLSLLPSSNAVSFDIFSDNTCSAQNFVRNSSGTRPGFATRDTQQYVAGVCGSVPSGVVFPAWTGVDTPLNYGIDLCTPTAVTVAIFQSTSFFRRFEYTSTCKDSDSSRLVTVAMTPGACVPVNFVYQPSSGAPSVTVIGAFSCLGRHPPPTSFTPPP